MTPGAIGAVTSMSKSLMPGSMEKLPAASLTLATTWYKFSGSALAAGIDNVQVPSELSTKLPSPAV